MSTIDFDDIINRFDEELKEDLLFDDFSLHEKQLRLPGIKHKWVGRLIRYKADLYKIERAQKELLDRLQEQIIEESIVTISNKNAIDLAKQHDKYKKLERVYRDISLIIDYLERVEKICAQSSFDIKNIIELRKLELM